MFLWWHWGKYKKLPSETCFHTQCKDAVEEVVYYVPVYDDPRETFPSGSPELQVWFLSYGSCKSRVWFCLSHLMSLSEFWGLRTYISVPILPLAPWYLNYLNFFLYLDFIICFLLIASYLIKCIYVSHHKISNKVGIKNNLFHSVFQVYYILLLLCIFIMLIFESLKYWSIEEYWSFN